MASYLAQIKRVYFRLAQLLLNTVILLILLNVGAWIILKILPKDHYPQNYFQTLKSVHADLVPAEIDRLFAETNLERKFRYAPYLDLVEGKYTGKYVNVTESGFRPITDQGPWPPDEEFYNIFVFGGSTTFGYGVADDQTIPAYLKKQLPEYGSKKVRVYNFGQGYFYSTQEMMLLMSLVKQGNKPDMAIFIDGLNDFIYREDASVYSPVFRETLEADATKLRLRQLVELMPMMGFYSRVKTYFKNTSTSVPNKMQKLDKEVIPQLINRYLTNLRLIEAISGGYDITPVFVIQPVPSYHNNDETYPFRNEIGQDLEIHNYAYSQLEEKIKGSGKAKDIVWCADIQKQFTQLLYVDRVHYTPFMSEKLAECIVADLTKRH